MFDQVHFQNFKSLVNVTLDLGRFTVLVGPNGCGKSSALQGMHDGRRKSTRILPDPYRLQTS
jgi:predicted ATPase